MQTEVARAGTANESLQTHNDIRNMILNNNVAEM